MSVLTRRESRGIFPDLLDWFEPPYALWRPLTAQSIRTEESIEDGRYILRAEMPGIDPEKQAEVKVLDGVLTIHAERQEETEGKRRSEFRYGSFTRQISLPQGAEEKDITAKYEKGILEVSVGLKEPVEVDHSASVIPIKSAHEGKAK